MARIIVFYNPSTSRFIGGVEATVVIQGMNRRVPYVHPVRWDYSEINEDFVRRNVDFTSLPAFLSCHGDGSGLSGEEVEVKGYFEALEENVEVLTCVFTDEEKLLTVCEYLLRVGDIRESFLTVGYKALVAYFQGHLTQVKSSSLLSLIVCCGRRCCLV